MIQIKGPLSTFFKYVFSLETEKNIHIFFLKQVFENKF